jgi:hypothetical protein
MESKPTHARPQLYAYYFLGLKEIAKEFGYNLVVHGSMNRDLDLIAIPWVDNPKSDFDLINALAKYMTGCVTEEQYKKEIYLFKELPGGRKSYVINLNRGGYKKDKNGDLVEPFEFEKDPEYYIDISVTPPGTSNLKARNDMIGLLENYSTFLAANGYMDEDWRSEPPFAIDEFLKLTDGK